MEDIQSLRERFHNDSSINPRTNRLIKKNSKIYKALVKEFGLQSDINDIYKLPNDVLYNVLLQSDYTNIKSLCIINKYTKTLCQNEHFWKTKFNLDHINVLNNKIPKTMNEWLIEYIKVSEINHDIDMILKIKNSHNIIVNINHPNYTQLYNMFDVDLYKMYNTYDNMFLIFKFLQDSIEMNNVFFHLNITLDQFKTYLLFILYHYPKTQITDETGTSFKVNDLIQNIETYGYDQRSVDRLKLYNRLI